MRYGKFVNKGILARESPAKNYKPIEETAPETPEGFRAVYRYVDAGDVIVTEWEYIELTDEEKREIEERGIDDAIAFDIIFGGGAE